MTTWLNMLLYNTEHRSSCESVAFWPSVDLW